MEVANREWQYGGEDFFQRFGRQHSWVAKPAFLRELMMLMRSKLGINRVPQQYLGVAESFEEHRRDADIPVVKRSCLSNVVIRRFEKGTKSRWRYPSVDLSLRDRIQAALVHV
jgi:hypothetical protein